MQQQRDSPEDRRAALPPIGLMTATASQHQRDHILAQRRVFGAENRCLSACVLACKLTDGMHVCIQQYQESAGFLDMFSFHGTAAQMVFKNLTIYILIGIHYFMWYCPFHFLFVYFHPIVITF